MIPELAMYVEILSANLETKHCSPDKQYIRLVEVARHSKQPDWGMLARAKHINHLTCGFSTWEAGIERNEDEKRDSTRIQDVRTINEILQDTTR